MSVCRLCSSTELLTDIFHPLLNNAEQLRFYFLLATGLEIREDDIVSKMVCHRCCEIAVKLHKYRANAVANDKLLKEQCGQPYVPPTTDQDELRRISAQILTSNGKLLATPYGIPSDGRLLLVDPKNTSAHDALDLLNISINIKQEPVDDISIPKPPEPYKHDSVKTLYREYPSIILPESVYKCDVAPVVTLDESEVEQWAEEEFKRVQQRLSWSKIIMQKVSDTSGIDKSMESTENAHQANGAFIVKKRPGPKSKTLDILTNDKPLLNFPVKARPGPKSKTIDIVSNTIGFEVRDKIFENGGSIYNKPGPKCFKTEAVSPVLYRPGPKSRKAELIQPALVKPVVHESQTTSTVETTQPKPFKVLQKTTKVTDTKEDSIKKNELKSEVSGSSRATISSNILNGKEGGSDYDDDDDFDPGNAFMDEDDDTYSSEGEPEHSEKTRVSKNREVNRSREERSRRPSKGATLKTDEDSDNDSHDKYKTRSTRQSGRIGSKKDNRPVRSTRRASSIESSKSDESAKKRKLASGSKIESKHKSRIESSNKGEVKSIKSDATKSINHKSDTNKNIVKEDLSKKLISDIGKFISSDKKEATKLDKKDLPSSFTNDKRESPKLNIIDKKVPSITPIQEKAKDDPPSLLIGKAQKIYMCHTCCHLFDTNKELSEHQKQHLICKYCNYRMKNIETLKKHQRDNCRMNTNRLIPRLRLTKVDTIKSIVNQYPKAFDDDDDGSERDITKGADTTTKPEISRQSRGVVARPYTAAKPLTAAQPLIMAKPLTTAQPLDMAQPQTVSQSPVPTAPINISLIKSEIVCVSDDSEDEVQCTDEQTEINLLPKSFLELPLTGMTENDMIRSLFTKHLKAGVLKLRRATQTFLPRATDIKYTNSNLIVLENLFDDLLTYKIPVELEIRPKISARFTTRIPPPPKGKIESWAHIKAVTIRKPSNKPVALAPKPVWIAPAKFHSPSSILSAQTTCSPSNPSSENTHITGPSNFKSLTPILPAVQNSAVPNDSLQSNKNFIESVKFLPSHILSKQTSTVSTVTHAITDTKFQMPSSIIPATQALVVANNPPLSTANAILLNSLLSSSPSIPASPLLTGSNLILSANTSLLPTDKNSDLLSLLGTSSVSPTNMTTTLIQTSNTGTFFMQNGISPNSTTIIQTPNNATFIQTPNASVIQTGNSATFITPGSTPGVADRNLLQNNIALTVNAVNTPVSTQNSVVLMQAIPQISNQPLITEQTAINTINSNNILYQSPADQIYQINNTAGNVNKVVVFSNTLSNGLSQNVPLYTTPYSLPSLPNVESSSVSIEEIEDNPQDNSTVGTNEVITNQNKPTTIRIKPSWELY